MALCVKEVDSIQKSRNIEYKGAILEYMGKIQGNDIIVRVYCRF